MREKRKNNFDVDVKMRRIVLIGAFLYCVLFWYLFGYFVIDFVVPLFQPQDKEAIMMLMDSLR